MDLNTLWFVLIAVLFTGFFFLEGFDYGVGILLPFLGKDRIDRDRIIASIGPFWDANETWMVTAGGAMFAAFPDWYATLFSGFYLALALMLLALIGRGVAFEFRHKLDKPGWAETWDKLIFVGSAVPALLWGVALGNILRGVPIDATKTFTGTFLGLLNPYSLLTGLAALALAALHGALFLVLKVDGELLDRARVASTRLGPIAVALLGLATLMSYFQTGVFGGKIVPGIIPITGAAAILLAGWLVRNHHDGWAFAATGVTIAATCITVFAGLFPRVMISSTNPDWSLTIHNAASSHYTLTIMTVVAAIFVPIILAYQAWTYWVFRERIRRPAA